MRDAEMCHFAQFRPRKRLGAVAGLNQGLRAPPPGSHKIQKQFFFAAADSI